MKVLVVLLLSFCMVTMASANEVLSGGVNNKRKIFVLYPSVTLLKAELRLSDIGRFTGAEKEDEGVNENRVLIHDTKGIDLTWQRQHVKELISRIHEMNVSDLDVVGARKIEIRHGAMLSSAELAEIAKSVITRQLAQKFQDYEIKLSGSVRDVVVDESAVQIRGELKDVQIRPKMCVWLSVLNNKGIELKAVPVWFDIEVNEVVAVLVEDALSHAKWNDLRISWEKRRVEKLVDAVTLSMTGPKAMRLTRPMIAGTVITSDDLQMTPEVEKGAQVLVVVESQGITISAPALAIDDGAKGDRVRLQSLSSQEEFVGVVTGTGEVFLRQ